MRRQGGLHQRQHRAGARAGGRRAGGARSISRGWRTSRARSGVARSPPARPCEDEQLDRSNAGEGPSRGQAGPARDTKVTPARQHWSRRLLRAGVRRADCPWPSSAPGDRQRNPTSQPHDDGAVRCDARVTAGLRPRAALHTMPARLGPRAETAVPITRAFDEMFGHAGAGARARRLCADRRMAGGIAARGDGDAAAAGRAVLPPHRHHLRGLWRPRRGRAADPVRHRPAHPRRAPNGRRWRPG